MARPRIQPRNPYCFHTLNATSAYWCGFIMADGSVSKCGKFLSICISRKDKQHLETLAQFLGVKVKDYDYNSGVNVSEIHVCSEQICQDLSKYGIIPNKSRVNAQPSNLSNKIVKHFIRGYLDGDGSISIMKPTKRCKQSYLRINFTGNKATISWILEIINQRFNFTNSIYACKSSWQIAFAGKRAITILDWLYDDAIVYLRRKYAIYALTI